MISTEEVERRIQATLHEDAQRVDAAAPTWDPAAPTWLPGRRPLRARRSVIGAGFAALVLVGGAGAAGAATNWFGLADLSVDLGPAQAMIESTDPASAPGAVVQITEAGPAGTTLEVSTATAPQAPTHAGACIALTIIGPGGTPEGASMGQGACSLVTAPAGEQVPAGDSTAPDRVTAQWTSPSGRTYVIVYGYVPTYVSTSVVSVALADSTGRIATTANTRDGWYVIPLPAATYATHNQIFFRDANGSWMPVPKP